MGDKYPEDIHKHAEQIKNEFAEEDTNLLRNKDNSHSFDRYNTLYNNRGAAAARHEKVTNRNKSVTSWGQYSIEFDEIMRRAGTPQDKRLVAEALGLRASHPTFRRILRDREESGDIRPYKNSPYLIEWINRTWKESKIGEICKQTMLDIKFPLGIHELALVPPRSSVGIAGVTGGGKTAFLMELAELNVFTQPMPVYYWYHEGGEELFELRCQDYPLLAKAQAEGKFHASERTDYEYGDVIVPNAINLVDYVDRNEDFFAMGDDIYKVYQPLDTGIVVFGLQKNPDNKYGVGGKESAKLSSLYISLDITHEDGEVSHGKATIVKAKYRTRIAINPVGLLKGLNARVSR